MKFVWHFGCLALFIINLYFIDNKFMQKNIELKPSNVVLENINYNQETIIIPKLGIEEKITDYSEESKIKYTMNSDYLVNDKGNIIIECHLDISKLTIDDHIIIKNDNSTYLFKIKQLSNLEEFNHEYNVTEQKKLYLINYDSNIFIKATLFTKNNLIKVT